MLTEMRRRGEGRGDGQRRDEKNALIRKRETSRKANDGE